MALIVDLDNLTRGTEVVFDTTNKTIQLIKIGNLDDDGVTLQALYSFCKNRWKLDSDLIKFPFPLISITEQKYEFVNGWTPLDPTTINLIRYAGFAIKDSVTGLSTEEYMGFVTLGSMSSDSQVYYQQSSTGSATDIILTGAVNQCVKIYGDASHGLIDYRNFFKCFVRKQGKLYDQSELSAIGQATVTYQVYSFPLGNSDDLKITHDDTVMLTEPYSGMLIEYFEVNQPKLIGGISYDFNIIISCNGGSKEQVYEFVQYKLRQDADIDSGLGTVIGLTANSLCKFVGSTLIGSQGVFLDNISATDINTIELYDVTNTKRTYPYVAAGVISFNENLIADLSAVYRVYYANNFGTSNAVILKDNDGVDISGNINGQSSISFTFDYDGSSLGGRTPGTDFDVVCVCIGLSTAQYIKTQSTIKRTNANSISMVASLERNFINV